MNPRRRRAWPILLGLPEVGGRLPARLAPGRGGGLGLAAPAAQVSEHGGGAQDVDDL
jgi:hypothetical protein